MACEPRVLCLWPALRCDRCDGAAIACATRSCRDGCGAWRRASALPLPGGGLSAAWRRRPRLRLPLRRFGHRCAASSSCARCGDLFGAALVGPRRGVCCSAEVAAVGFLELAQRFLALVAERDFDFVALDVGALLAHLDVDRGLRPAGGDGRSSCTLRRLRVILLRRGALSAGFSALPWVRRRKPSSFIFSVLVTTWSGPLKLMPASASCSSSFSTGVFDHFGELAYGGLLRHSDSVSLRGPVPA